MVRPCCMRAALIRLVSDPIDLPPALDLRTLAFVLVVSLVTGLLLGLLPALRTTRTTSVDGPARSGPRRRRLGRVAARRPAGGRRVSSRCRCRCSWAPACSCARSCNLQHVDLGYSRDDLRDRAGGCAGSRLRAARNVVAFRASPGGHPRAAERARGDLLEQRPFRRRRQRRSDRRRRLHVEGRRRPRLSLRRSRARLLLDAGCADPARTRNHRRGPAPRAVRCASSTRRSRRTTSPAATRSACT